MDCCKNELGDFPHNADINTGIVTDENGLHKLLFTGINGTKLSLEYNIVDPLNDKIVVQKGNINESMFYCFTVKKPSGAFIEVDNCPNFCLKTFIETNKDCGDLCVPPADDAGPISL